MTSEQIVKQTYPTAEIRQKPFLNKTEYAVFKSENASSRHNDNILGRGLTASSAWVNARKNMEPN